MADGGWTTVGNVNDDSGWKTVGNVNDDGGWKTVGNVADFSDVKGGSSSAPTLPDIRPQAKARLSALEASTPAYQRLGVQNDIADTRKFGQTPLLNISHAIGMDQPGAMENAAAVLPPETMLAGTAGIKAAEGFTSPEGIAGALLPPVGLAMAAHGATQLPEQGSQALEDLRNNRSRFLSESGPAFLTNVAQTAALGFGHGREAVARGAEGLRPPELDFSTVRPEDLGAESRVPDTATAEGTPNVANARTAEAVAALEKFKNELPEQPERAPQPPADTRGVMAPQRFDADPQAIIDYNKWEAENAPPGGYREISEVARPTDASELEIQQAARELNALDEAAAESPRAPAAGPGPAEAVGADRPAPGNGPAESTSLRAADPAARSSEPLEAGAPEEGNPRDVSGQVEGDNGADEAPEARSLGAGAPGDLDRSQVLSRAIAEKPSMASRALREIQEQLSPVQVDEASRIFGGHLKEQNAIQALENQRFTKDAVDGILKLDRLSPQEQNDFFDKAEQGLPQASPELDQVAAVMRRYQDAQTKGLVEGGHLEDVIQNYMPHQYENEALGLKLFNQRQSSIPNWQKERTYPLRSEAQAAGLTPKYPNPVEDVLTSYGRKGDYLATATAIKKGIDDGVIQVYDKNTSPAPGTDLVELDPKFVKMAGDAVGEGQTLAAPRSIATLLERNASVGLNKYAAYRGARAVAGGLNTAQLLGPFHAATSAFNSFYSRMGLGVTEALRSVFEPNLQGGRLAEAAEGAKDIALSPLAPILEGINGYKARKAALEHSGLSPVDQELVAGGHRIDMSEDYTTGAYMAFRRAVAQSKNAKAAALFPGAVLDRVMYPIMQVLVPSLKTGHYLEAAAAELKRLGPEASEAQKRQSLGRVADAVDDRFGQLVYDNGFWNKTFRNAMQLAMRSPGWVAGSLRAGLGGAKDIVRVPSRFAEQRNNPSAVQDPVITQRMGYLVAQAVGPMLVGSLYGYLKGGNENKQKYLDYVAPKTGGKNKSGTPERYVPAGYTKEFYAWHHDPFATAISKRNPMLSLAQDLSAGKDFIGTPFRNPNDPALTRMKDSATYALEQMAPIFSRGTLLPDPNINPRSNIGLGERMVGAPAPAYMASEEKMNKATESRFLKAKRKRTSQ